MRLYNQAKIAVRPVAAEAGASSIPSSIPGTPAQNIALNKLTLGPGSRRKASPTSISALADRIHSSCQFQSLLVVPAEDSQYYVVAGDRRFAALRLLAKQGRIPSNFGVPCRVINATATTEASATDDFPSTAENFEPDERRRRFVDLLDQYPELLTGSELAARRRHVSF